MQKTAEFPNAIGIVVALCVSCAGLNYWPAVPQAVPVDWVVLISTIV